MMKSRRTAPANAISACGLGAIPETTGSRSLNRPALGIEAIRPCLAIR